jgi:hypothetical protein
VAPPAPSPQPFEGWFQIGGGPDAIFCWWFGTASAQGRETSHPRRRFWLERFPATTTPDPPHFFQAMQPTRPEHFLDPRVAQNRPGLTAGLTDVAQAIVFPRVVLLWAWDEANQSPRRGLQIERHPRKVDQSGQGPAVRRADGLGPWEAVKAIASSYDPAQRLRLAWLTAVRDNWLRGVPAPPPDTELPQDKDFLFRPRDHFLANGLLKLAGDTASGEPASLAGFVDYFLLNDDRSRVMDGSFEYQYSLSTFLELDTGDFLLSPATAPSPFVVPKSAPIAVVSQPAGQAAAPDDAGPVVRLTLVGPAAQSARPRDPAPAEYPYRVESAWQEVGGPVQLGPADTVTLVDRNLARSDFDQGVTASYGVLATQYAVLKAPDGTVVGEKPVRTQKEGNLVALPPVTVPAPPAPDGSGEVEVTIKVLIDRAQ